MKSAAQTGKPLDPPLLMVVDEAANTAPMPELDVVASSGAGQGIQLVTAVQDFAQVEARWGKRAQTVFNNHVAKIFPPGISDSDTSATSPPWSATASFASTARRPPSMAVALRRRARPTVR
jgi:type IV secretory pathway TraG/TraD family ATPase VirD4